MAKKPPRGKFSSAADICFTIVRVKHDVVFMCLCFLKFSKEAKVKICFALRTKDRSVAESYEGVEHQHV